MNGRFPARANAPPRDDAIIFSDLLGKLDVLEVASDKCAGQRSIIKEAVH
jgi:hypothetical protein